MSSLVVALFFAFVVALHDAPLGLECTFAGWRGEIHYARLDWAVSYEGFGVRGSDERH